MPQAGIRLLAEKVGTRLLPRQLPRGSLTESPRVSGGELPHLEGSSLLGRSPLQNVWDSCFCTALRSPLWCGTRCPGFQSNSSIPFLSASVTPAVKWNQRVLGVSNEIVHAPESMCKGFGKQRGSPLSPASLLPPTAAPHDSSHSQVRVVPSLPPSVIPFSRGLQVALPPKASINPSPVTSASPNNTDT